MSVSADRPPLYPVIPLDTGKDFFGGNFQQLFGSACVHSKSPKIFIQFEVSLMYPNICVSRCCPGIFEFRMRTLIIPLTVSGCVDVFY